MTIIMTMTKKRIMQTKSKIKPPNGGFDFFVAGGWVLVYNEFEYYVEVSDD